MSVTLEEKPKTEKSTAKFIQIACGNWGTAASILIALDEAGDCWYMTPTRDDQWERLPKKRAGGPGRPASR